MYKKIISAMYALNIVMQALFSLVTPALFLFGLSYILIRFAGAPRWIYAIGISVGILIGLVSMIRFAITASENLERLEKSQENKKKRNTNEK